MKWRQRGLFAPRNWKAMGKSKFQNHWLSKPEYKECLTRDGKSIYRAYCRVCQRGFDVQNMGEAAVKSHMTGNKHVKSIGIRSNTAITTFLKSSEPSKSASGMKNK